MYPQNGNRKRNVDVWWCYDIFSYFIKHSIIISEVKQHVFKS